MSSFFVKNAVVLTLHLQHMCNIGTITLLTVPNQKEKKHEHYLHRVFTMQTM